MDDILIKTDAQMFSYRVAGILINDGKLLLQKPVGEDECYAFPGGQVSFGETSEQALIRELKEELGTDIAVLDLRWVEENFFPWDEKNCHQISLSYTVALTNPAQIPSQGSFFGSEYLEGRSFNIEFHWIPLSEVKNRKVYPENTKQLLEKLTEGVQHFIYREE